MPEIKHNFTGGKMQKDLDERLVPNGEYRHAMNIEVSSSDDSNVGSVQNVPGNELGCNNNLTPINGGTVGSISDEKNDTLYWFVASLNSGGLNPSFSQLINSLNSGLNGSLGLEQVISGLYDMSDPLNPAYTDSTYTFKDMIMRKKGISCEPVFVDTYAFISLIDVANLSANFGGGEFITNIPEEIFSLLDVGWNVTSLNPDGSHGNTQEIITIMPKALLEAEWGYDPGFQTYGGAFNTGKVNLALSYTLGMPGQPQEFFLIDGFIILTTNNLSNTFQGTPPVGATIEIVGVTQPSTTIISKSICDQEDSSGLGFSAVKIELSLPFDPTFVSNWVSPQSPPPLYNTISVGSLFSNVAFGNQAILNVDNNGTLLTGSTSFSAPTATGNLNGDLIFGDSAFESLDNASAGDAIDPSTYFPDIGGGVGGYITNPVFSPDPYVLGQNGTITLQIEDDSGNVIIPTWFYGPAGLGGTISLSSASVGSIQLAGTLQTNGFEALLFNAGGGRVLAFDKTNQITAINILDDMLIWTDGLTEPNKINITRSIEGTDDGGNIHTRLVNKALGYGPATTTPSFNIPIRKEHITVIKKAPLIKLSTETYNGRDISVNYSGIVRTAVPPLTQGGFNNSSIISSSNLATKFDFGNLTIGEKVQLKIETLIDGSTLDFKLDWKITDEIVLKEFTGFTGQAPDIPISNYTIKGVITNWNETSFESNYASQIVGTAADDWPNSQAGTAHVEIEIVALLGTPKVPFGTNQYQYFGIDKFNSEKKLFEFKFPRFSYRYKYEDNEYSTYAPFTNVVFQPGTFDYHPKKGYNLGMVNQIEKIILKGFAKPSMPKDVVEVDILYKEDSSPNIYILDTLRPNDPASVLVKGKGGDVKRNNWEINQYTIDKEIIKGAVGSNQLLRPYDNVPKTAVAQEISGNRIVYANYEQNIDLKVDGENYKPEFRHSIGAWSDQWEQQSDIKSIKSLREYQLGVVFTDKYGRETPVLSSPSGVVAVTKDYSATKNQLEVGFEASPPDDAEFFKFFIKENSGEYYNLAMDRWFDADDGNIWLSFPSTERNKIDENTYLILKKGQDESVQNSKLKYGVIAIENEAPDYIKTKQLRLGRRSHNVSLVGAETDQNRLFGNDINLTEDIPRSNNPFFALNYGGGRFANSTLSHLDEITDGVLYCRFEKGADYSLKYRIAEITADRGDGYAGTSAVVDNVPNKYFVTLENGIEPSDIDFIYDNAANITKINNGVSIAFYNFKTENSPKFDGRFFVKIHNDGSIKQTLFSSISSKEYSPKASRMVYLLDEAKMTTVHRSCMVNGNPAIGNVLDTASAPAGTGNGRFNWDRMNTRACFFSQLKSNDTNVEGREFKGFYNMEDGNPYDVDGNAVTGAQNRYLPGIPWTPMNNMETEFIPVWFINRQLNRGHSYHPGTLYMPWAKNTDPTYSAYNDLGILMTGSWRSISIYGSLNTVASAPLQGPPSNPYEARLASGINTYSTNSTMQIAFGGIEAPGGNGNPKQALATGLATAKFDGGLNNIGLFKRDSYDNSSDWVNYGDFYFTDMTIASAQTTFNSLAVTFNTNYDGLGMGYGLGIGQQNNTIDNFFMIGEDGGNDNYTGESAFVDCIKNPGNILRWADDPTKTIYESSNIVNNQLYRLHQGDSGWRNQTGISHYDVLWAGSPANYTKNHSIEFDKPFEWNPDGNYGSNIDNGLSLGIKSYTTAGNCTITNNSSVITLDAPNENIKPGMTISTADPADGIPFGTKVINVASDLQTITLSQVTGDTDGAVTFGYMCQVIEDLDSTTPNVNYDEFHVRVSSLDLECDVYGEVFTLKEGMRLTTYNVGLTEIEATGSHTNPVTFASEILMVETNTLPTPDNLNVVINGSSNLIIKNIEPVEDGLGNTTHKLRFAGYTRDFLNAIDFNDGNYGSFTAFSPGTKLHFHQPCMNSASPNSQINGDNSREHLAVKNGGIVAIGYEMEFLNEVQEYQDGGFLPNDPFVWETENEDIADLDIFYEITGSTPVTLKSNNIASVFPVGSRVKRTGSPYETKITSTVSDAGDEILVNSGLESAYISGNISGNDELIISRPNGNTISARVHPDWDWDANKPNSIRLKTNLYNSNHTLDWFNCYSFGNGVESNRVRDSFNLPFIQNGVKASSVVYEPYAKERRQYGLIYSGIYNSTSGVNNLNQFSMAEKITKDVNPIYGSIQKLHSGDTAGGNLIALCEDRVLGILANKDAIFNADGNPQLIASDKVLGNVTPFSGKYGISKNPESFASHAFRAYFTDKVRGTVLRLSKDGLTPISDFGMKDWFRDNLKLQNKLIGSYDDKKAEYNITLSSTSKFSKTPYTVTFKENVKGWSSFKSFIPENGISCANEYYTFDKGKLWLHNVEDVDRNTFYNERQNSIVDVIFNNASGLVKSFATLNYEGSQSKVSADFSDGLYHNLSEKTGWHVTSIATNKETGSLLEFIKKEGKWFNYIKGTNVTKNALTTQITMNADGTSTFDQASFAIQGLGIPSGNIVFVSVEGCTDPNASNFNPAAVVDDGSCIMVVNGCMVVSATNFDSAATDDDGSCIWIGCNTIGSLNYAGPFTDALMYNNNLIGMPAISNIGCIVQVDGCTDSLATNYNASANFDDGSCILPAFGCMISHADNYDPNANGDDGTCTWYGCWYTSDLNYGTTLTSSNLTQAENYNAYAGPQYGLIDDGTLCVSGGCTYGPSATEYYWDDIIVGGIYDGLTWGAVYSVPDPGTGMNFYPSSPPNPGSYDSSALHEDGSCSFLMGCIDPLAANYYSSAAIDDGTCIYLGCTDSTALNYNATANVDDGSCEYPGCPDLLACNYNSNPNIVDDGSCDYILCAGCMSASTLSADGVTTIFSNNNNTQTGQGVYDYCMDPTNTTSIPCTIPCGDGTNATDQGDGCCNYIQYGCTDSAFCNFDPYATYGDFTCSNDSCTGCMDADWSLYNTNPNSGSPQTNTLDCAGVPGGSDVSCCGTNTINGCMDPNACNYDANANTDPWENSYVGLSGGQTSCIYKIDSVAITSYNANLQNIPTATSMEIINDINFNATNYNQQVGAWLYFNPTGAGNAGNWPVGNTGNTGAGNYQYYNQNNIPAVNENNKIRLLIEKKDLFLNTWSDVSLISDEREADQNNLQLQLNNGFPFGNVLDVYSPSPQGYVPAQYRYTVYSELWKSQYVDSSSGSNVDVLPADYGLYKFGGTPTANHTHYSPQCGVSADFSYSIVPCDSSNSVMGCTDPLACNYDQYATCDDGSCNYGIALAYEAGTCNQVSGCQGGVIYNDLAVCCTDYPQGAGCPQQ